MKKVLGMGFLLIGSLMLGACSNTKSSADGSQKTVDSLSTRVKELETSNSNLQKTISSLTEVPEEETTESSEAEETSSNQTFGLNEEAILRDGNNKEQYSLKIVNATTNVPADSTGGRSEEKNLIQVTYEYKNYAMTTAMQVSTQFLAAYDATGLAGKDLGYMDGQTDVGVGKASQSTMWFSMPSDQSAASEIEIEYSNDFSLGFEGTLNFKVPLSH